MNAAGVQCNLLYAISNVTMCSVWVYSVVQRHSHTAMRSTSSHCRSHAFSELTCLDNWGSEFKMYVPSALIDRSAPGRCVHHGFGYWLGYYRNVARPPMQPDRNPHIFHEEKAPQQKTWDEYPWHWWFTLSDDQDLRNSMFSNEDSVYMPEGEHVHLWRRVKPW